MRWLSFERDGEATFGLVKDDGVVDARRLAPELADLKAAVAADRLAELARPRLACPPICL